MQEAAFEEGLDEILKKEHRYHRDAYLFVKDALDFTHRLLGRQSEEKTRHKRDKHVTAHELLDGIRDLALETFGPMTITVFEEWGIRSCRDFGEIVFVLVEQGVFAKTERDSRADFEPGYDFQETFRTPFLPQRRPAVNLLVPKPTGA
jgi:uncharacterized repeat protein (TIGR04138 family)